MLLAHSKTSTHCEPITVILAGVEAPELAAILGFVYTGSATVPRPRLDAFLHAAEALHIALPPVPLVMTCAQSDCKQEDIKDVKIDPKYLRSTCDQYPCCDRCYRPRSYINQDGDGPAGKQEGPYPTTIEPLAETAAEIRPLPESMNFAGSRYGPSKYRSTTSSWPVPPFAREKMVHGVDQHLDKERTSEADVARYRPISVVARIDRVADVPTGIPRHWENHFNSDFPEKARGELFSTGAYEPAPRDGGLELPPTLEARMKSSRLADEEEDAPGNDSCGDCNSEKIIPEDRLSVIRSRIGPVQSKTVSLSEFARNSYERTDFGEDLTCRESCFVRRSPKRQVANRVIASPWKQTVKPYHLPKMQPMAFLQPHVENVVSL